MRSPATLLAAVALAACSDTPVEPGDESGTTGAGPATTGDGGEHDTRGSEAGSHSETGRPPGTDDAGESTAGAEGTSGGAGASESGSDTSPGRDTDESTSGSAGASSEGASDEGGTTDGGESTDDGSSTGSGTTGVGSTSLGTTGFGTTGFGTTDAGTTGAGTSGEGSTDDGRGSTDGLGSGETDAGAGSDEGESGEPTGTTGGQRMATCDTEPAGTSDPCQATIAIGHTDTPDVGVGTTQVVTWGPEGNAIVRDAETLAIVYVLGGVDDAELAGDRLLTLEGPSAVLRDASDGAEILAFDPGDARGLSDDGSYVWTADDAGFRVRDASGAVLWAEAGDYSDVSVLALPGFVHLHAPAIDAASVRSIDLTTLDESTVAFAGDFEFFFTDQPRFVTAQGDATRVYDTDGSILFFELEPVTYGRGDWIVRGADVVNLGDPDTPVHSLGPGWRAADDLIAYRGCPSGSLLTLGPVDVTVDDFDVGNCGGTNMDFDADPGGWLAAINPGRIQDHLGNSLDTGGPLEVEAALGGRVVVRTATGTDVYDHLGECEVAATASLSTTYSAVDLAADGSAMIGRQDLQHIDMVSLPGGGVLGTWCHPASCVGSSTQIWGEVAINDDASWVSIHSLWTGAVTVNIYEMPGESVLMNTFGFWGGGPAPLPSMLPFAPCGGYAIESDMSVFTDDPIEHTALGYVHFDGVFDAAVFDGLTFGFLDADRALVGRYEANTGQCGGLAMSCFTHSEIVGMDGLVLQATDLPETRRFHRITATEILVEDPARIYDVYSGDLLWTDAGAEMARPAGPDHVVVLDGGVLRIETWRDP